MYLVEQGEEKDMYTKLYTGCLVLDPSPPPFGTIPEVKFGLASESKNIMQFGVCLRGPASSGCRQTDG